MKGGIIQKFASPNIRKNHGSQLKLTLDNANETLTPTPPILTHLSPRVFVTTPNFPDFDFEIGRNSGLSH